jgi:hypothetical protein
MFRFYIDKIYKMSENERVNDNDDDDENIDEINLETGGSNTENEPKVLKPKISWTKEHVEILIDLADKGMCYRWLHSKNTDRYRMLNAWFTIPVIIMSTLTGTANFAQDKIPIDMRSYYTMIIGGVNILAGILTTIQQFLKIGPLNESHRGASIAWDKFHRKVKLELAKSPTERQDVEFFLKNCSEEFGRLIETSPNIDGQIIRKFKTTFEGNKGILKKIRKLFKDIKSCDQFGELDENMESYQIYKVIKKPAICDSLETVRGSVYEFSACPINASVAKPESVKGNSPLPSPSNKVSPRASPQNVKLRAVTNRIAELARKRKELELKEKIVEEFYNKFNDNFKRFPSLDELIDNIDNIPKNIIIEWHEKITHSPNTNVAPTSNSNGKLKKTILTKLNTIVEEMQPVKEETEPASGANIDVNLPTVSSGPDMV